jgi:formylmethanofuran dehydrogenase subunit E
MAIEEETLKRIVEFHGHMCPGLATGIQAAQIALREIGPHSKDEEVVAVAETDMCGVDAIQFLTGCTFGKGNLIHHDWGKNAYSFFRRSDGKAIRVVMRPDGWERDPQHQALRTKVEAGEASDAERARFRELHQAEARRVLEIPPDRLFRTDEIQAPPPPQARVHATVLCAQCGEGVMETRVRRLNGRELCQPCFERILSQ